MLHRVLLIVTNFQRGALSGEKSSTNFSDERLRSPRAALRRPLHMHRVNQKPAGRAVGPLLRTPAPSLRLFRGLCLRLCSGLGLDDGRRFVQLFVESPRLKREDRRETFAVEQLSRRYQTQRLVVIA